MTRMEANLWNLALLTGIVLTTVGGGVPATTAAVLSGAVLVICPPQIGRD